MREATAIRIRSMTKPDFDYLVGVIDDWWGRPVRYLLHPIYLYEFGNTAWVAEQDGRRIDFIAGFVCRTDPQETYIHLVGTDPGRTRRTPEIP